MKIEHPNSHVIQIIPALGWWAVFKGEDGKEIWSPLACWGLTNQAEIVGIEPTELGLDYADEASNFDRYELDPDRIHRFHQFQR